MRFMILLFSLLSAHALLAQEDVEQYMLSDSLQIEALVDKNVLLDDDTPDVKVSTFTIFGLSGRQFNGLSDLNMSLDTLGYGMISETGAGWIFGNRIDIGDHFSLGYSYLSNFFFNNFNVGDNYSSKYTYFSVLFDLGYRQEVASFQLTPGIGFGFSQNILSLKPNNQEAVSWDELHDNRELITSISQADFTLSTYLSVGKYFIKNSNVASMLDLKVGMLFHPFHFGEASVTSSDWSFVQVTDTPPLGSSGIFMTLVWGAHAKQK